METNNKITMLQSIATALSQEDITSKDAQDLSAKLGISKSFFTKNKTTRSERKRRRVEQREARRCNRLQRKNGCSIIKGQKKSGRI